VQVNLSSSGGQAIACGDQDITVQLTLQGSPSAGDSVYVILPQGVSLAQGSYAAGLNAPQGPPTPNAEGFQLPLPELTAGSTVIFKFKINFQESAGCDDPVLQVQTRVRSEAYCQTSGSNCTVYASTGEALWLLGIPHSQLNITEAKLFVSNGKVNGAVTVSNIGDVSASGATVQVWRDMDGNGDVSANDVLINTLTTSSPILPNGSATMIGLLENIDSSDLCGIMFLLPANLNCNCDYQLFPLNNLTLTHTPLLYCTVKPVQVGLIGQSSTQYQWEPNSGLSCTSCPMPMFTPGPNTPPGATFLLTLKEIKGDCVVLHEFSVTYGASASILADNQTICVGNFATLSLSANAAAYQWSGAGIQNPTAPQQTVSPQNTSTYSVTATFADGCTASAGIEITVLRSDTVALPPLSTCQGVPVQVFGNATDAAGTYQLKLPKSNGCDSLLTQSLVVYPKSALTLPLTICRGDSALVFGQYVRESGQWTEKYSTVHGCDSLYTVQVTVTEPPSFVEYDTIYADYGAVVTLNGPPGYQVYEWEPMPTPPCSKCPNVQYKFDTSGYFEVKLRVTDADGCSGEVVFRIIVFPPCSANRLHIPNAFTPNGDGANDLFRVVPSEGSEVVGALEIYDRWGQKVYENRGAAAWDGTIDGKPAPSDVYVYIVSVICGELVEKRYGDVTLLR
jgi:hypothetical protein